MLKQLEFIWLILHKEISLYKVRKAVSSAVSSTEFSGQTNPTNPSKYAVCSVLVLTFRFHYFQANNKPIICVARKQVWWFYKGSYNPIKLGCVTLDINYISQEFARIGHHFLCLDVSTRVLVSFSPYLTSCPLQS